MLGIASYFHPPFSTYQSELPVRHKQKLAMKKLIEMYGFMTLIYETLLENLWKHLLNCFAEVFYRIFFKIVIIDLGPLTIDGHY